MKPCLAEARSTASRSSDTVRCQALSLTFLMFWRSLTSTSKPVFDYRHDSSIPHQTR